MTRTLMLAVGVVAVLACNSGNPDTDATGRLSLKDGESVTSAAECGVNKPQCPQGSECISFKLDGVFQVRCLSGNPCALMQCSPGTECAVAASYPGQMFCSGKCTADCDSSVSSSP